MRDDLEDKNQKGERMVAWVRGWQGGAENSSHSGWSLVDLLMISMVTEELPTWHCRDS